MKTEDYMSLSLEDCFVLHQALESIALGRKSSLNKSGIKRLAKIKAMFVGILLPINPDDIVEFEYNNLLKNFYQ